MSRIFVFIIAVLAFPMLFGQNLALTRHVHQAFEISEDVQDLRFDLHDIIAKPDEVELQKITQDYVIESWAGNTILVETTISISQARVEILDFFIKEGRYSITFDSSGTSPLLSEAHPKKKTLRTKEGECFEHIKYRIFVPDVFGWDGTQPKRAIRKPEGED